MISLLSPAKKLDFDTKIDVSTTKPAFLNKATIVNNELKKLSPEAIADLQHLSENLANLNFERNQQWQAKESENTKPALFAFKGDVYVGLDAETLLEEDLAFAQQNIRILSGLYGYLKPMDEIMAYRLEMGTKFPVQGNKNLYEYWKTAVTNQLIEDTKENNSTIILNLASKEYAQVIDWKHLKKQEPQIEVIEPVFKDWKTDKYKIISFFAKKARGLMARFVIDGRINSVEKLKEFNLDGYSWNPELSASEKTLVFTRRAS